MPWAERQRDLLQAMGLRVFAPPAPALLPADDEAAVPAERALPPAALHVVSAPRAPRDGHDEAPPPQAAGGVAALGWPALREAVAACRACSLCEARRQTVFGVGHPRAHWMVVGEAPGEQEDARGEPFVGPAGQLLDNMLAAVGLARTARERDGDGDDEAGGAARQVFICNTLKCRPPRNRNPEPQELAACEPFLERQIALVQPRIILAMGRFAVQSLLKSAEPVGRLRGRVHRFRGVPLVVTYHPAYLLRNMVDKARAWDDLCLAADVVGGLAADAGSALPARA